MTENNVSNHILVPKHTKLSEEETRKLLSNYNITRTQLPLISIKDPIIKDMECKEGDIIKIKRKSKTSGTSTFYRIVQ